MRQWVVWKFQASFEICWKIVLHNITCRVKLRIMSRQQRDSQVGGYGIKKIQNITLSWGLWIVSSHGFTSSHPTLYEAVTDQQIEWIIFRFWFLIHEFLVSLELFLASRLFARFGLLRHKSRWEPCAGNVSGSSSPLGWMGTQLTFESYELWTFKGHPTNHPP